MFWLTKRKFLSIHKLPLIFILFSIIVFFFLAGFNYGHAGSVPQRITIAYSKDTAPFHFMDDSGQPAGIIIDTWLLWSKKTGIPITFQVADWNKTLTMVGSGEADVHAGLFFNAERDKFLDYGAALTKTDTHYFSHVTLPQTKEIDGLAAYRVGVIEDDFVEGYLKKRLPKGTVLPFSDYDSIMKALQEGTLKVFAADTPTGLFHLNKNGLLPEFSFVSEKPLYQNDWCVAVQEGNKALIEVINRGMAFITDKEKSDIIRRWVSLGDKEGEAIIISINRSYAPLSFINSLGKPSGLFVDMWRAWAQQAGRKIIFRASNWLETIEGLRSGVVDIHSGISFSKERAEWLDFSTQIYETFSRIYHRTGDKQPKFISGYGSNIVGTQFGTYQDAEFRKIYPDVSIRNYGSTQDLIEALLKGEVKAIVDEELIMATELDRLGLRGEITARSERLLPSTIHAGILKGNAELLEQINIGFAALGSKKLEDIEKRWISNSEDRFYDTGAISLNLSPEEKSWLAEHPIIRVAPDPDFVPIEFFDEQGQYAGLAADFLNMAAERLGVRLESIQTKNWPHALEVLSSGEADLIGANVPVDEFKKDFIFTEPYFSMYDVIIAHDEIKRHVHLKELAGKEILVVKGWPQIYMLQEQYPNIKIVEAENTLEALLKIVDKEYDYFLASFATASYLIQKQGLTGIHVAGILAETNPSAAMVRKDSVILRNLLNKALASISMKDRSTINKRWLPGLSELESKFTMPIELNKEQHLWLSEHPVIRVAMDPDWAPVEYADEQGNFHGISMDYLRQLSNTLGIRFETVKGLSWQEAMDAMENGDIDLLPSMANTPEREARYSFTRPYISMPINIFAGGDVTYIGDLNGLEGKQVAVVNGYFVHELLKNEYSGIKLLPVESVPGALKMLAAGKADAFVGNALVTSLYITKLQLNQIKVVGETPFKNDQSIAVRKDWAILTGILQKALEAIPQHEKDAIFNRWVSVKYEHGFNYSLLWKAGIPAFFILLFLLYWNKRLGREIDERRRAEKRSAESEDKMRAMSDASHDAMIMIDSKGFVMFWNTAAEKMFEYTNAEVMNKNMHSLFVPEEFRKSARAGLKQFAKSGHGPVIGSVIEQNAVKRNGETFPVEIAISSFQVENEWYAVGFVRDITDRKKIETQIKAARKELLLIFDSSQIGIIFTHKKGEIARVNKRMTDILGYETPQEMIGMDTRNLLRDDDHFQSFKSKNNKLFLKGKKTQAEYELHKKDGSSIWCSLTGKAVDTNLPPDLEKGVIWVVEDITQRKQMEDEIRQSEENFRIIADYTYGWESWYNKNGVLLWVNPAVECITGYSVEECHLQSSFPNAFVHPEDKDTFSELKHAALAGKEGNGVSFRIIHKTEQKEIWGEVSWNPVFDNQGQVTGYRTSVQNITDRKMAEEELQAKESRFRGYFENSLVGVTVTHPDKGWIEINGRFLKMLGYMREELETLTWEDLSHPNDLQADLDQYYRMLNGEISHYSLVKRFLKKDSSIIYTNIAISCVRNSNGEIYIVIGSFMDITEAKKTETEMKQYVADLEKFNHITISREERMIDLKDEINQLLSQLGKENKYKIR